MTELFFRNTNCVRELSAEGVDFLNIFLRNGGCAVKNYGESGESLAYFFENVETERRGNEDTVCISCALSGCELVCAVGCADGNSEGVDAGSANEVFNLFGLCVGRMFCAYLVFNACKNAELAFYNYAVSVSVFNNLLCESDVVLISMMRAVYHNGREAAVDARLADFKVCAVVEVECEVDTAVFELQGKPA